MLNKKQFLASLCITAIFSGLGIVLEGYLKIPFPFLEISLAFVPILICGMLLTSLWGGVCAVLVDFVATAIAGQGAYFFGFAPIVFMTGYIFGLIGVANRGCKSDKTFCIFSLALVIANGLLCEGVFKSYMICMFQVFISKSQPDITWPLFANYFVIRIIFAAVQAAVIFALALLARKQIIPRINKVVRKTNG